MNADELPEWLTAARASCGINASTHHGEVVYWVDTVHEVIVPAVAWGW